MYKRYSSILSLILLFSCSLFAQGPMEDPCLQEKCNDQHKVVDCRRLVDKKAFILTQVELTEEEQKLVWPIFEAFEQQARTQNQINHLSRNTKKTTQEDFENALNIIVNSENREGIDIQKYIHDLEEVLSPEKTYKFFEASRRFKIHLIKQMRGRNSSRAKNKR